MQRQRSETWHDRPLSELTAVLNTDGVRGLAPHEAAARLRQEGPNALRKGQTISPIELLAAQFRSLVI
jgi:magnesium-transporting ATPase (P-type)